MELHTILTTKCVHFANQVFDWFGQKGKIYCAFIVAKFVFVVIFLVLVGGEVGHRPKFVKKITLVSSVK